MKDRKIAKKKNAGDANTLSPLVPAKAGTQRKMKSAGKKGLDSRLRGNERRESLRGSKRRGLRLRQAKHHRKKLTPQQWQARENAERETMRRQQCNLFQFWLVCARRACARARSCAGNAEACFAHWWPQRPEDMKQEYREMVIAEAAARGIAGPFATGA